MKSLFLVLLGFTALNSNAQNYDPLTLSHKIFSTDTLPDIKKYSTGDYEGHPNGRDIMSGLKMSFELLAQNDKNAVVVVTLSDSTGMELNRVCC